MAGTADTERSKDRPAETCGDEQDKPLAASAEGSQPDPWNQAVDENRKLDLAEYPGALLMRVATVIHQQTTAVYAREHDLSVPEWRILGRLCVSAPIRRATLCRLSNIDKAQASRVIQTLQERGLVDVHIDASHRNRQIIDITDEGRDIAERIFPEALAEQLKLLRTLTPEERRTTFKVLRKLLALYGLSIPGPAASYKEELP
ncbi:MarR family winged helix-turn-helix transcriptional regulator [Oricola sp.]|uniref:MarR family winged helix-turn-helix transcriptional regulator n=1 Tax=Oricola sp. TaxID=1979950 RepID=UPI0025EB9054|nr:MarR family winged helix-turn-helix transcriptional regulator [Oricola sp.]MCI5075073.1 MarR family winged helix-turn-helix transcriptional regulator [Oricola sp.]